jgi:hypothetical protein
LASFVEVEAVTPSRASQDLNTLFLEAYNWGSHPLELVGKQRPGATASSNDVDEFIWNHPDMVILFSAGNEGTDGNSNGYVDEGSIGSPATAKNAISSGASDNERFHRRISIHLASDMLVRLPGDPTANDFISDNRQELAAFSSRGPVDDGRIKPDGRPGNQYSLRPFSFISGNGWGPTATRTICIMVAHRCRTC